MIELSFDHLLGLILHHHPHVVPCDIKHQTLVVRLQVTSPLSPDMLENIFLAEPIEWSEAVQTNVNRARISNDEL